MDPKKFKVQDTFSKNNIDSLGERFPIVISSLSTTSFKPSVFYSDPLPDGLVIIGFGLVNHLSTNDKVRFQFGLIDETNIDKTDWRLATSLHPHFFSNNNEPSNLYLPSGQGLKLYDIKFPIISKGKRLALLVDTPTSVFIYFSFYLIVTTISAHLVCKIEDDNAWEVLERDH